MFRVCSKPSPFAWQTRRRKRHSGADSLPAHVPGGGRQIKSPHFGQPGCFAALFNGGPEFQQNSESTDRAEDVVLVVPDEVDEELDRLLERAFALRSALFVQDALVVVADGFVEPGALADFRRRNAGIYGPA